MQAALFSWPLEHDPEKWTPVFRERSCSNKQIERDDDSKKSHPALASRALSFRAKREPGMTGFQVGVVSQTGLERTLDRGRRDFIPPRPGTARDRQRERSRARPLAPRN